MTTDITIHNPRSLECKVDIEIQPGLKPGSYEHRSDTLSHWSSNIGAEDGSEKKQFKSSLVPRPPNLLVACSANMGGFTRLSTAVVGFSTVGKKRWESEGLGTSQERSI